MDIRLLGEPEWKKRGSIQLLISSVMVHESDVSSLQPSDHAQKVLPKSIEAYDVPFIGCSRTHLVRQIIRPLHPLPLCTLLPRRTGTRGDPEAVQLERQSVRQKVRTQLK